MSAKIEVSATHLIPCLSENAINIIVRLPDPWHTLIIVPEAILKDATKLDGEHGIGRLLVYLGTQGLPSFASK